MGLEFFVVCVSEALGRGNPLQLDWKNGNGDWMRTFGGVERPLPRLLVDFDGGRVGKLRAGRA